MAIGQRQMFNGQNQGNRDNRGSGFGAFSSLPNDYLKKGYFEEGTRVIKREYLLGYAQDLAQKLSSGRPELKKTQIRGFYEKVKYAYDNVNSKLITLDEALASVCQLSALAHNSVNKKNAPELFEQFINENVNKVVDYDSLKAFEQHFKAIICYYPEKKR